MKFNTVPAESRRQEPAAVGVSCSTMDFFRGEPLSPEELARIRREIESFDSIEVVDDELRALLRRNWPHLLAKLPPEDDEPAAYQLGKAPA